MQKILVIYQGLNIDLSIPTLYDKFGSNFDILIVCPSKIEYGLGFGIGEYDNEKTKKFTNVTIKPINLLNYKNPLLRTLYGIDLYRTIKEFKPDIIHCYTELFSPTLSQVIFFKNLIDKEIKVVNYSWENLDWSKKILHGFFGRYAAAKINCVVCANEEAIREVKRFDIEDRKISKIYWGIDFSNFKFEDHDIGGKTEFKIGFIGRLLKDKGIQNLIESIANLGERYNLSLIGEGADKEYFISISNELGIQDRIKFHGKIEYSKLKEYIKDFDIFILPSISKPYWKEQFGRVLVEMMASGVPVIGSSSGAIPEVIGDRGLIFKEGDSIDLSEKIREILSDPIRYSQYSKSAYEYALDNYSQDVFMERLKGLYEFI
ncbi:MAG: glycosyltransferase family 4 protein [Candidatus Gracilibacteria bacterium]|nr:glycosyltransferase family 4 protein [Candidatus Gracilibacteria bacterium]